MSSITRPSFPAAGSDPSRSSSTQTVKVLHLINGEHYSGAERVQDLLALGLPSSASKRASLA